MWLVEDWGDSSGFCVSQRSDGVGGFCAPPPPAVRWPELPDGTCLCPGVDIEDGLQFDHAVAAVLSGHHGLGVSRTLMAESCLQKRLASMGLGSCDVASD